jgi:1-acyl-sn-glycerol-3-phosphate acyltransferase
VNVVVSGPVPAGPVVLVANHVSWLDPLALARLLPCVPFAKREVSTWPIIGAIGRQHGVVFVDRRDAWSGALGLRSALRALAAGVSVLNFPEGTTTTGESMLPFRRGVFGLARLARVPVVPAALGCDDPDLTWTGSDLFLPHYLRTIARRESVIRVRFGWPMTPERYGSAEDLAREARAAVQHLRWES